MARQPLRSLRVPDRVWFAAMETANDRGESLNAAVNRFLATYAGLDAPEQSWFLDQAAVHEFGVILAAADGFEADTAQEALDYVAKPWKWDDEHDTWGRCGSPTPPERPADASENWQRFVDQLQLSSTPEGQTMNTPEKYLITHPNDRRTTEHVTLHGLREAMQKHGLRFSELADHIKDVDAGHVLTADDGTQFQLADVATDDTQEG